MSVIYRNKSYFDYMDVITYNRRSPYALHFHNSYEIYYFIEGEGYYLVEDKKYDLFPGDMIITNPRELHAPRISCEIYHRITINVQPVYLAAFISGAYNPFKGLSDRPLAMHNYIPAEIVREKHLDEEIRIIGAYYTGDDPARDAMLRAHMLMLLDGINKAVFSSAASQTHGRIQAIVHYINEHLSEKITLSSVAQVFFMERCYLSDVFHKQMGMTLTDYITSKRIQRALELFWEPMSLLDIALAVGFSDYAAFYRAFKKLTGMSPQDYRKHIKG